MRPQNVTLRQSAFVQNACTQIRPPRCMERTRRSLRVSSVSAEVCESYDLPLILIHLCK